LALLDVGIETAGYLPSWAKNIYHEVEVPPPVKF